MSDTAQTHVAIACGGTGGHFFPAVAVARELIHADARPTLLISEKKIDRQAVSTVPEISHLEIPAVGLNMKRPIRFFLGLRSAIHRVREHFAYDPPNAVLAMGGFTAAAPIHVGRQMEVATFLHESNVVPGRANRLLSHYVDEIFIEICDDIRIAQCTPIIFRAPTTPNGAHNHQNRLLFSGRGVKN